MKRNASRKKVFFTDMIVGPNLYVRFREEEPRNGRLLNWTRRSPKRYLLQGWVTGSGGESASCRAGDKVKVEKQFLQVVL